ncbi:hypothetical protein AOQ73_26830 [Bradyrhizobium pachyrhizi]|uniref:hypothetical protein n=1 Tax=Bradyrhizobium pachyrhizi TaxID=280333 RepID=UPI000704D7DB|nr:hypothetical protein [Bradyrhizobium pachyrhizi]KRP89237.1 hypothetical protein AOQ73_26830 [Bradyrhizobium pachyrhizi]
MTEDPKQFSKDLFRAAQHPVGWLLSAERLRDAAEIIMRHEVAQEIPYFRAHSEAVEQAMAEAYSEGRDAGVVEVRALPPNYPPAQLLYAYAIENALKGLIVANSPGLIDEQRLSGELQSHDLTKLEAKANFPVHVQEGPVLEALSKLSIWAGRYPVARTRREQVGVPNADAALDYGSAHPIMRIFFDRARQELEGRLSSPLTSRFGSVVVAR